MCYIDPDIIIIDDEVFIIGGVEEIMKRSLTGKDDLTAIMRKFKPKGNTMYPILEDSNAKVSCTK